LGTYRGGAWDNGGTLLEAALRGSAATTGTSPDQGFRCMKSAQ
jgi:formylglycine-generating enzyme required for sulfatase activity